jgi:diguanylate cyclase (GGDEF)-like protein
MAEGRGRSTGAAVAAVAVAVAGFVGIVAARPGSPALTAALTGGLTTAAALVVAVLWLRATRWASGRAKLGLRLLCLAMLGWAAGDAAWVFGYLTKGSSGADVPPLADVAFAFTMLLAPLSVALLFGTRRIATVRTLLDAVLIATGLLYVTWATVLGPVYRAEGGGIAALASLAYPLADMIIASMVLILARSAVPAMRTPAALAAIGVLLMCASDSTYVYLSVQGTYRPGHGGDIGWFLGFMVVAVATPRRHELAGSSAPAGGQSGWLLLPYLPFVLALGTAVAQFVVRHGQVEPTLYVLSTVLTVLVMVRQLIVMGDNRRLNRRLRGAVEDLRYRAYHDPLTRLANRDMFLEAVERALTPATGAQVGVLFIDLDAFKPVNDTLGHAAGDRVLIVVAERLNRAARLGDVVARLGGDEFAIMLPDLLSTADAKAVAQRIQSGLEQDIDIDGEVMRVGASIGIAYGRAGRIGLGELLRNADVAMYTAKLQGRRRTVVFEPQLLSRRPLDQAS